MLKTQRVGERPQTSDEGPHRQVTQMSSPSMWGELIARVFAIEGVVEGHSQVSPKSSRAVFLADMEQERAAETNLAPGRRLEPVHLHGVTDTSVHLVLPHERGEELVALGWVEPHQYEDFGAEYMIYGPRDAAEVDDVVSVIEESIAFARGARSISRDGQVLERVRVCRDGLLHGAVEQHRSGVRP